MKKKLALLLAVMMLLVSFVGCDSSDYKKACELYDQGSYAEAAAMFDELGDYEDSAERAMDAKYMNAQTLADVGSYAEAIAVYEQIAGYKDADAKCAETAKLLMYETYADVFTALESGVWFYEETAVVNAVNVLTFTKETASVGDIYYDGNGGHVSAADQCAYIVDDANITITKLDGSDLVIPYAMNGAEIVLGNGEYFTAAQVDAGLQGYWGLESMTFNAFTGFVSSEYIFFFDNGTLKYESATEAYGYNDGTYYYYGPYDGTYTITANGMEAETRNNWQFGFVIRDGKVVMNRCGDDCSVYDGFKGENGYSF